jgi:hypothetical protein
MRRELLKEAIELEEPVGELPDAVAPDLSLEEPEVDPEVRDNAIVGILTSLVTDAYANIDSIKSAIATISTELPERDDITSILGNVADERTTHVGMLQKAIDLIDGKSQGLVDSGKEIADNVADNSSDANAKDALEEPASDDAEPIEDDSKEEGSKDDNKKDSKEEGK